jgi:hypothetical protein
MTDERTATLSPSTRMSSATTRMPRSHDRAVRSDVTVEEVMALVAGAFAAITHAGAEASRERSAHIAQLILDGLRPQAGRDTPVRSG